MLMSWVWIGVVFMLSVTTAVASSSLGDESIHTVMFLEAETRVLKIGHGTSVNVMLQNNVGLLNAFEVELLFDPGKFHVKEVLVSDTLCEDRFIIEQEVDVVRGRIYVACGTISPAAEGAFSLLELVIEPSQKGLGIALFGTDTHVYVHDGRGTSVSPLLLGSTFEIVSTSRAG